MINILLLITIILLLLSIKYITNTVIIDTGGICIIFDQYSIINTNHTIIVID